MKGFRSMALVAALILTMGMLLLASSASATGSTRAPPLGPAAGGYSPPQVTLWIGYSVIGGGDSQAQNLLTYVTNGNRYVATLTESPATYSVDSGSQWSAQTILNGSSNTERWITNQDVTGTISVSFNSPLIITYYHQYRTNFNYNVTRGGAGGYSGPNVSFSQFGGAVSQVAPQSVWLDAGSQYTYDNLLPGSSNTERWIQTVPGSGTANVIAPMTMVTVAYNHEFTITMSYSLIGASVIPKPPALSTTILGSATTVSMSTGSQSIWSDAGATYSFTSSEAGVAGERWQGTVLQKTQSGSVLSMVSNGTVITPVTVTPVYYHQFLVNVSFIFTGGTTSGLTPPAFSYQSFGSTTLLRNNTAVWVDGGTQYLLPETFCCSGSGSNNERWELNNSTSGTVGRATRITANYFHQFYDSFSYAITGQAPPSPSGQPVLTYVLAGNNQQLMLLQTPQSVWTDALSTYSVTPTLSASASSQRWFAQYSTASISGTAQSNVVVTYNQQYLLTIVGGGLQNQWVNAGNTTTLSTPAVFGRSQGTGNRVVSYQIDSGKVTTLPQPASLLTVQISMNGPHTITFSSVRQFQLTLDGGATTALSSITPPTITGDSYWYDTGSPVQVNLTGAFGRAHGVGQRIINIAATAQAPRQVNTVGTVQAYANPSIQTSVAITTTSITQFEVVLNAPALAALASITPASTFPNDTFWYDSGAPTATVTLNATYARALGAGFRITSWEIDAGPPTKIASTGTIKISTGPMSSPHFLNATNVAQYLVTIDKSGTSAIFSMTSTPIPSDASWYDAGSPLGVVMNGAWGRANGPAQRLASYAVNGAAPVVVASTGYVVVLNLTKLASPMSISTLVVTQYQVVLDSGATSALASITAPPIPKDSYWYDGGTPVTLTLNGIWGRTANAGNRLVSYSLNQGTSSPVLSLGSVQVLSLTGISGSESVSTKTAIQYHLSSSPISWTSITNSTVPSDTPGWFDSGTAIKANYNSTWNQTGVGTRSSITSYTVDTSSKTNVPRTAGTFTVTLSMNSAHSVTLNSVTQYLLTVLGGSKVTTSPASPTGDSYFDNGAKVTVTVATAANSTKPGVRQLLSSYSLDGGALVAINSSATSTSFTTPSITFTKAHLLIFNSALQYQVAFQFFDGSGRNALQPSDVQIVAGNATMDVQGQPVWLANGTTFHVVGVIWEGASVGPVPAPTFQVQAAPLNVTLKTKVYPASLRVTDLLGLPVSGAQVAMTLANGTTIVGTTKDDGTFAVAMIPIGTYTATVSSLGSSAQIVGSAATSQTVAQGRVFLSLISLFAIVAVVVGGAVTGLLLLRKRKEVGEGIAV